MRVTQILAEATKDKHTVEVMVRVPFQGYKRMQFDCTFDQFSKGLNAYQEGKLLQDAFPFLTDGEREFLLTGITPDEWVKLFPVDTPENF